MGTALLLTLTYLLLSWGGMCTYISAGPMILGAVTGALLGDIKTGIILGGTIQAMFLGVMNVGGTLPADSGVTTMVVTALVIKAGLDIETGIAIAYPLGTIAGQIYTISTPIFSIFDVGYDKLIYNRKDNLKMFDLVQRIGYVYEVIAQLVCIFVALSIGSDAFISVINAIPANIMTGLAMAGNMMVAVGLGLTLQMIWSPALGGFFFIGFFLTSVVGMNSVQVALVGIGIAFFYFSLINNPKSAAEKADTPDDGGDFF